jgi:hypothetical protein
MKVVRHSAADGPTLALVDEERLVDLAPGIGLAELLAEDGRLDEAVEQARRRRAAGTRLGEVQLLAR